MKRTVSLMIVVGLVLTGALMVFSAPQATVEKGKEVYTKEKCQMCHSIAKVGNPKNPLDGVGSKLTEELVKKWIKTPKEMNPKTTMKAFAAMSDADLGNLVAYMMSLKK